MKKSILSLGLAALLLPLSGCMEAQEAPVLPETTLADYSVETVADNLDTPWSFAELPLDQGILIAERGGVLKRVKDGEVSIVSGLPDDIYVEGQAGLFDILITADYTKTGYIYLSYARGTKEANGTAVIIAKLENDTLSSMSDVYVADPFKTGFSHYGGVMSYLPGGVVALGLGEGFEFREASQNDKSDLGKIMKIHPPKAQMITKGHRNIQGLFFDPLSFNLWAHEHGPRGGDELNLIKPGQNYGWPIVTEGLDYTGAKITPLKTMAGMTAPIHTWTPSIAPSGLFVYSGDMFPEWQGDIFVGGLASQDIRRLDMNGTEVLSEEIILSDIGARIRDVNMGFDGSLMVLAVDGQNSRLLRVTPKAP